MSLKFTPIAEDQSSDSALDVPPVSNATGTGYQDADKLRSAIEELDQGSPSEGTSPSPPQIDPEAFTEALHSLKFVVQMIGNKAADRFNVSPVTTEEAEQVTASAIMVAEQYDIRGPEDPKTAAWTMFLLTLGGVVGTRLIEVLTRSPEEPEKPASIMDFTQKEGERESKGGARFIPKGAT